MGRKGAVHGKTSIGVKHCYLKAVKEQAKAGNGAAIAWLSTRRGWMMAACEEVDKAYRRKFGGRKLGGACEVCGGTTTNVDVDGKYMHRRFAECEKHLGGK